MKHLLTLSLFLVSIISYCQNLTLGEVVELRKKDANEVINTLKAKGWEYDSFKRGGVGKATVVEFMYLQGSKSDPAQVIESEITHYSYNNIIPNRLVITVLGITKYQRYLDKIVNGYKCKVIYKGLRETKDGNYNTTTIYQGATTTFIIELIDERPINKNEWRYSFTLVSNKDYNENMK